jgi:hypothetical protein
VAVDIRQRRSGRDRRAVDPVQSGSGNLDEPQPPGHGSHRAGEEKRDEDVDLRQLRESFLLVGVDDLAGLGETGPHPIGEAGRQRSQERDPQHGDLLFLWAHAAAGPESDQFPGR